MNQIGNKVLNWASILDEVTEQQAVKTAAMPFVTPHLALMPDAHLGKGSTVGSVIPTIGAIMPAAVGVDIGCGMMAVKTSHKVGHEFDKRGLRESIESQIPLSAGNHNNKVKNDAIPFVVRMEEMADIAGFNPDDYAKNWREQLGSLGSGNHFIEVTKDEEGFIWLFLHSGSRGIGNKIALKWIEAAQKHCERNFIQLADKDLAYLIEDTYAFDQYIAEMTWAQEFAFHNREVMMSRVKAAFKHHAGEFQEIEEINCHHNFTQIETHHNKEMWITRKGAISAFPGEKGLIPGSMGTASYVVEGLGHPASFCSAPHGAGRQHARNQARKLFDMESLEAQMDGIEWSHSTAFLDEHPEAYKPIDVVMEDAQNLVTIKHTLNQLVNVKGD